MASPSRAHLELPALVPALEARLERMLGQVMDLIRLETPSADLEALDEGADLVAHIGAKELGVAPERVTVDGRHHLRWRLGSGPRRVLVLAHYDTVWPLGTLSRMPFKVEGERASGPGVYDMKASLVLVEFAIRTLQAIGAVVPRPVVVLLTSDEEIGSPTSRHLIESEAAQKTISSITEAGTRAAIQGLIGPS